ncbi:MAG: hypothetical protein EOM59_12225 [Clostridia bacterium]|nr:hypothetical protein [Clostridia bacterium]
MKTIEAAAIEHAKNLFFESSSTQYLCKGDFATSFVEGVEFAQRRIHVKEELPDEKNGYINKEVIAFTSDNCAYILIYDDYLGWLPNGTDADIDNITHWRPIEYK